jgi:hypothetical protein
VARDDMLGIHVKIFRGDRSEEHITIRLHPEAHRALAEHLRDMAWVNDLRTRSELEAEGATIVPSDMGATDTAAWYAERQQEAEENRAVARVLMRSVLRATSLDDLEAALAHAAQRVDGEALFDAMREGRGLVPRWDERLVDLEGRDEVADGWASVVLSADEAEVLVLRLGSDGRTLVLREDHDRGEAILRARGVIQGGPPSLTR